MPPAAARAHGPLLSQAEPQFGLSPLDVRSNPGLYGSELDQSDGARIRPAIADSDLRGRFADAPRRFGLHTPSQWRYRGPQPRSQSQTALRVKAKAPTPAGRKAPRKTYCLHLREHSPRKGTVRN